MMKRFLKKVASLGMALCMAIPTLVGCDSEGVASAFQADEATLRAATATAAAAEQNISVPYEDVTPAFTVHVSPNGDNANDGSSWEKAVTSLNQAQLLVREWYNGGNTGIR